VYDYWASPSPSRRYCCSVTPTRGVTRQQQRRLAV